MGAAAASAPRVTPSKRSPIAWAYLVFTGGRTDAERAARRPDRGRSLICGGRVRRARVSPFAAPRVDRLSRTIWPASPGRASIRSSRGSIIRRSLRRSPGVARHDDRDRRRGTVAGGSRQRVHALRKRLSIWTSLRGAEALATHGLDADLILVQHHTDLDAYLTVRHLRDRNGVNAAASTRRWCSPSRKRRRRSWRRHRPERLATFDPASAGDSGPPASRGWPAAPARARSRSPASISAHRAPSIRCTLRWFPADSDRRRIADLDRRSRRRRHQTRLAEACRSMPPSAPPDRRT